MNLDDFSVQVDEETRAIKPEVALGEQQNFIQNLRNIQNQQNAEIRQQTHDLGTDIPSNLGGLTGGEGYFNARFQQPFTNAAVGDLRAAAQAQALSEAFDLELARANARYKSAYDAYRRRAGTVQNNNPNGDNQTKDDVDYKNTDKMVWNKEALSDQYIEDERRKIFEEQKRRNTARAAGLAGLMTLATAYTPILGPISVGANEIRKRIQGK